MDFGGRYQRKSLASDHFLSVYSPPDNSSSIVSAGDELNEDGVFWTGDFAEKSRNSSNTRTTSFGDRMYGNRKKMLEAEEQRFGILAALSDDQSKIQPLRRKASFSPSKSVLPIPKKVQSGERDAVAPKFNFSAPVNVPVLSKEMMKANARNKTFFDVMDDDGEGGDDEMLPPHEIVARGSALTPNTAFSMLEGAGRTLKGRDLRRVRNASGRLASLTEADVDAHL